MSNNHLAIYLNDHRAGAVAALDLLDHLESEYADTPWQRQLVELRADIAADCQNLEGLMEKLHVPVSRSRQAMGWLGEKIAQMKLRWDDPRNGALRRFEAHEALAVGIDGKRALWGALAAAKETTPALKAMDYERLDQRAVAQRRFVDQLRLDAAKVALAAGLDPVPR